MCTCFPRSKGSGFVGQKLVYSMRCERGRRASARSRGQRATQSDQACQRNWDLKHVNVTHLRRLACLSLLVQDGCHAVLGGGLPPWVTWGRWGARERGRERIKKGVEAGEDSGQRKCREANGISASCGTAYRYQSREVLKA